MTDLPETVDITAPRDVEIRIRDDGRVIWINIDGLCRLRACQIGKLTLSDDRQLYDQCGGGILAGHQAETAQKRLDISGETE